MGAWFWIGRSAFFEGIPASMTYITQISRLRDCGVYQNFSWPRDLPEFGRYNLIYGWNATGKTTLSRLFRNLQLRQKNSMGEVVLKVDGNRVHGKDFQDCNCHIRVFNRDFIDENVFSTEGRDIPRILFLGKDRIEKQQKLESLKKCYEKTQSRETAARAAKQFADKNFDQFSVDRAKLIKETLRSDVNHRYNNYNKSNFQHCAKKMLTTGNGASCLLSDGGRETLLTKCRATPKPKAKEFYYVFPSFNETTDRLSKLLTRTIISETIKVLTADPSLAGWTRQGLRLHRDRKSEQCLFCEQPLRGETLSSFGGTFQHSV